MREDAEGRVRSTVRERNSKAKEKESKRRKEEARERERGGEEEKERQRRLLRRLWTGRCANFKGPIPIFNLLRGKGNGAETGALRGSKPSRSTGG